MQTVFEYVRPVDGSLGPAYGRSYMYFYVVYPAITLPSSNVVQDCSIHVFLSQEVQYITMCTLFIILLSTTP